MDNNGNTKRQGRGMGLNIGSASVIMLFAVLALTVLAALSLLSANAALRIAEKNRNTAVAYYTADTTASEILYALRNNDRNTVEALSAEDGVNIKTEGDIITIETRVSDRLMLKLTAERQGDKIREISRKLNEIGQWIADEGMDIWDAWNVE